MSEKVLSKSKISTKQITTIGMLFAVTIVLGATGWGFIPIPPLKLTIMHIPVIIASILEGPIVGALTGLLFGIFSMIQAINTPTPVSFIFLNPIVAVIPRILIGVTPYYAYKLIKTKWKKVNLGLSVLIGSFTNTIGVMGLIYLLYIDQYANALHISHSLAVKTILFYILNGFVSGSFAVVVSMPIIMAVKKIRK
ncbi:ECF transporter S component [Clostridium sp. MB40-C1]|uniref:ECF transporter S component n=1 Tax=Clostridium sp. MB40-C1 TaxID=3070996 RepID=UPI0027DFCADB|nr:ECF transporter S component [Clostridium sp. MB40-C1]WMJ79360.1 ECF transporter S component [Clostridium sp. MB40-C1]